MYANANDATLRIPIKADYQIIDGKPVRVSAEYAEISADAFARFLLKGLGLSVKEIDPADAPEA